MGQSIEFESTLAVQWKEVTVTNERWLRWATARHFREKGFRVNMKPVKVGNAAIDGEVTGERWKMALEIKSGHDEPPALLRDIGFVRFGTCMTSNEQLANRNLEKGFIQMNRKTIYAPRINCGRKLTAAHSIRGSVCSAILSSERQVWSTAGS